MGRGAREYSCCNASLTLESGVEGTNSTKPSSLLVGSTFAANGGGGGWVHAVRGGRLRFGGKSVHIVAAV